MKLPAIYIIGLVDIVIGSSCEDVYKPAVINSDFRIPVVQAKIIEDQVPEVSLSWAIGYQEEVQENISGAMIYISDNAGDSVLLNEISQGKYSSYSDKVKGVRGRTYYLKIKMPDGNSYASNPVFLPEKPLIDSLYARTGKMPVYSYDVNNLPTVLAEDGLILLADLSGEKDSTLFYRFNTKVTRMMLYTVALYTPAEHSIFLWDSYFLDKVYSSNLTLLQKDKQILKEHHAGFLNYYYDASHETDSTTGTYIAGWIVTMNVYSISHDVYEYYHSISQQMQADYRIFSPEPSQLKTNIHCTTNPAKKVMGVFEASSQSRIYKAFGWKTLTNYNSKDLSSFPDTVYSGIRSKFPPNWWVFF